MSNIDKALEFFGTKAKLAEALDVSEMVVYQWSKRRVPVSRAVQIEKASGGSVLAAELRPDVFS